MSIYVELALPVPLFKLYTYSVPEKYEKLVKAGLMVEVSFNNRITNGIIFNILNEKPDTQKKDIKFKEIRKLLSSYEVINEEMMEVIRFLENDYSASVGEAARLIAPSPQLLKGKINDNYPISLSENYLNNLKKTRGKIYILVQYLENKKIALLSEISKDLSMTRLQIKNYLKKGILKRVESLLTINLKNNNSISFHKLTEEQKKVSFELKNLLSKKELSEILLFGITGSGKTEIYLNIMEEVLKKKGNIIYMVPEISLVPQTLIRLRKSVGDEISIWHSRMKISEKREEYQKIISGNCRIVIGTRSSIFVPLKNIKLIIIDEEHDSSYIQSGDINYDARAVAKMRVSLNDGMIIYGSATPSIKNFHRAQTGEINLLTLKNRIDNRELPVTKTINLINNFTSHSSITKKLEEEIRENIDSGGQTLLFLNRKGFAPVILCRKCGKQIKCVNCDVSMTYHRENRVALCHICGYEIKSPDSCPHCKSTSLKFVGAGTERIFHEATKLFPGCKIIRFDADIVKNEKILRENLKVISQGGADIIIATQIFSKGHDIKGLTLAGIISADTSMSIPDFRAAERTFQMLTQVTGRVGRDETPGKAFIQTFSPSHYAVTHAIDSDYIGFYEKEIGYRKRFNYPPFSRIIRFLVTGINEEKVENATVEIYKLLSEIAEKDWRVKKGVRAPIYKIKLRYRRHILIFVDNEKKISRELKGLREKLLKMKWMRTLTLKMEIDPEDIL